MDLFFDLLGWYKCEGDRPDCTELVACDYPTPIESATEYEPSAPRDAETAQPRPSQSGDPEPEFPVAAPAVPPDNVTPPADLPSLDQPQKPGRSGSDPTPEIPRNEIPKTKPAVPKSSRRTEYRTLIAERLSDYILTR